MTPKEFRALTRPKVRKLARQGKLVDTAFKVFQRAVFPGAGPAEVNALRIAFFAGAQEINALLFASLDEGDDPTDGDIDFMQQWQDGSWMDANTLPDIDCDDNWAEDWATDEFEGHAVFVRAGKKRTGRLLDGELHDGMPG